VLNYLKSEKEKNWTQFKKNELVIQYNKNPNDAWKKSIFLDLVNLPGI